MHQLPTARDRSKQPKRPALCLYVYRSTDNFSQIRPRRLLQNFFEGRASRKRSGRADHFSLAYSDFAAMRMGMSGSASLQRTKKSWYAFFALTVSPVIA